MSVLNPTADSFDRNDAGRVRIRASRLIVVACGLLALALVAGCVIGLYWLRHDTLAEKRGNLARLALALAEQTERSFQTIDLIVEQARDELEHIGGSPLTDQAALHRMLKSKIFGLPQGQALLIFGADGQMVAHSREFPTPRVNAADRDYFLAHQHMGHDVIFVSRPLRNRVNGRWMISLSRHFSLPPSNAFAGVFMAAIEVEYFGRLYKALDLPDGASVALQRLDGVTLVEFPWRDQSVAPAFSFGPLDKAAPASEPTVSGHESLVAIRLVPGFDLAVGLLLPEEQALASWRRLAWGIGIGVAAAVTALLALMGLLVAQVRKLETRETRLAQLTDEHRAILNSTVVGIVKLHRRRMIWLNDAFAELFGYDSRELLDLGTRIFYVSDENYRILGQEAYSEIRSGRTFRVQHQFRRKDGSLGWYDLSGARLGATEEDSIWAFVDITQQKAIEERLIEAQKAAENASRAKSAFLAMMSHEIRTPITGVLGMADLLRHTRLSEEQAEYINTLGDSAKALLTILNDVLDLSKLEAGKIEIDKTEFNLVRTIREAFDLFRAQSRTKGLAMDLSITSEVPELVSGDSTRLKQILFNLISNAVKFTESGKVQIRISAGPRYDGTAVIQAEITDTGIGMDQEQIGRLFMPFCQGDQTTTRRFGGTGLGLAITRQLVDLMAGEIQVESEPGRGTTFRVRLPFSVTTPAPVVASKPGPTGFPGVPPVRALRILLAEDNPINRALICSMLRKFGHQVDTAENGRLALERVVNGAYDAVLMDMQMPEMDGEEATRAIRSLPAPGNRLPVIALTADVMAEHRERYFSAGIDDLIPKPIDWAALVHLLNHHTSARAQIS